MSNRREQVRIIDNFGDSTNHLLDYLFPDPKQGILEPFKEHGKCPLRARNLIIYGPIESGKSEVGNALAGIGINKYEAKNVNAVKADRLEEAVNSIDSKPIQFIYLEDQSGQKLGRQEQQAWIKRRHICQEKSKLEYGMIITLVAAHRITGSSGIPLPFHQDYSLIMKRAPGNSWDVSRLRNEMGLQPLLFLAELEKQAELDESVKSHFLYKIGGAFGDVGRAIIPLDHHENLKDVSGNIKEIFTKKLAARACTKCNIQFVPAQENHRLCPTCYRGIMVAASQPKTSWQGKWKF